MNKISNLKKGTFYLSVLEEFLMLVGEVHQGHICPACLEKNVLRYVNEDHCPVCRGCDYSLEEDICYNLKCPRGEVDGT